MRISDWSSDVCSSDLHFTSTSGLIGNIGQANYSAAKLGVVALSQSIALDMARVGVRSNCIAPFAWSRMTASIPATPPAAQQRATRIQEMSADKIAPLVASPASDLSRDVIKQRSEEGSVGKKYVSTCSTL